LLGTISEPTINIYRLEDRIGIHTTTS